MIVRRKHQDQFQIVNAVLNDFSDVGPSGAVENPPQTVGGG